MGELSESLKKVSFGSILVVVGVIAILTMVIYWYAFSDAPSPMQYLSQEQAGSSSHTGGIPVTREFSGDPVRQGPDDRAVIVEPPSPENRTAPLQANDKSVENSPEPSSGQDAERGENLIAPGTLSIQAGAFSRPDGAEKLVSELNTKGFSSSVRPSGDMYRVFVGEFPSRKEAEEILEKLKGAGFSGYVRTVP